MSYADTTRQTDYEHGQIPTDLTRLEELGDYEVAEDEVDPRGWIVLDHDGGKIGTVKDLLVSPTTMRAHFAVIDCGGWFNQKLFAIPLEQAQFDREQLVRTPFTQEQFRNAPEWDEERPDYQAYYRYWSGIEPGVRRGGEDRVLVSEETGQQPQWPREAGTTMIRRRMAGGQYADEARRVPVIEEEIAVEESPQGIREVVVRTEAEYLGEDAQLRDEEAELEEESEFDEAARRMPRR